MSELLALSAAAAAERVRAGDLSPAELWDAYRARAAADDLNAFLWLADEGERLTAAEGAPNVPTRPAPPPGAGEPGERPLPQ